MSAKTDHLPLCSLCFTGDPNSKPQCTITRWRRKYLFGLISIKIRCSRFKDLDPNVIAKSQAYKIFSSEVERYEQLEKDELS